MVQSVWPVIVRKRSRRLARRALSAVAAIAFAVGAAHAQSTRVAADYPSKPIRFMVPSSPGGGNDVLARVLGARMTEDWGKQVVVENRSGAGGIIGSEIVAKAPADGYTILIVAGGYTLNPSLYAKLPYDTLNDFERVSLVAFAPNVLVVHSTVPVNSVRELIALAKSKPNYLNYATSGVGTTSYLAAEIFKHMTGVAMVHVPFKGAGDASAAVVSGQVHLIFTAPNATVPHVRAGRLKALGVTSSRRLPIVPDVPTIAETGLPGYEVNNLFGVLVPAKTPRPIIDKLHAEIVRTLQIPETRAQLEGMGFEVVGNTPEQFTAHVKSELVKWKTALRDAGVKPEGMQ